MDSKTATVLMWLEYAMEPETCQAATGLDATDCVAVAHQLLQGATETEGYQWALAQDAIHNAKCNSIAA